jgi:hypothetical protein
VGLPQVAFKPQANTKITKTSTKGIKMKGLVIAVGGVLAFMYLTTTPELIQRTKVVGQDATANGSQHHPASSSKSESAKAGPKSPGERLTQNKHLADKLSTILKQQNPQVTDIQAASQGFESLCQFVSAVHASQNLGIAFERLKSQEQTSGSLAEAIHLLKPDADVKTEVREASVQAAADLEESYWVIAQSSSMSM